MAGTVLKLDHKISTTTVVNTTTETDLYSVSIPVGALSIVGFKLRMKITGDILNNSAGAQTVVLKAYFDDTAMLTTKAISLAQSANRRKMEIEVEVIAETASAQRASGLLHISEPSTDTWATDESSGINATGYGTAAEATTAAKNLKVTATLGAADAAFEITAKMGHVELLR